MNMEQDIMIKGLRKHISTLQLKVNRLRKLCDEFKKNYVLLNDFEIKRIRNFYYLENKEFKGKNICYICGGNKKTTAHHLIPKRAECKNKLLKELRIRCCDDCNKKIHPENKYFEDLSGIYARRGCGKMFTEHSVPIFINKDKYIIGLRRKLKKLNGLRV